MKKETMPYFFFDLSFFLMHTPYRIFTEGEEEEEYIYHVCGSARLEESL